MEIADPPGQVRVGEQAAACGRGIVDDAQAGGERLLLFPAAAGDGEQLFPIDQPLPLRPGRPHQPGRERPQEEILAARVALDHPHGIAALGHGPLAEHLAGDEEGGAQDGHALPRPGEHEDLAVDAGVEMFAEAVGRSVEHIQVALAEVDERHLEAVFVPHFPGILLGSGEQIVVEERGDELERDNPHPQIRHHPAGKDRIETAGEQPQRRDGTRHGVFRPDLRANNSLA